MKVQIHNGVHKPDRFFEDDVHSMTIILSNGVEYHLRERQDTPGHLDIEINNTLVIIPKSTNTIRIRSER